MSKTAPSVFCGGLLPEQFHVKEEEKDLYHALFGLHRTLFGSDYRLPASIASRAADPIMAKRTLDRMYREWLEEQPDSPALAESPSRSKQPSCRARFPTLPKTPPRSPSPCLPHYPSDAAIHPDQAPLREALRIDSHGRKNIKLLERLGEKSTQPALLGNKDSMASKPSISSNDVVGLLAAQGQRRRKQIYDERKGLVGSSPGDC